MWSGWVNATPARARNRLARALWHGSSTRCHTCPGPCRHTRRPWTRCPRRSSWFARTRRSRQPGSWFVASLPRRDPGNHGTNPLTPRYLLLHQEPGRVIERVLGVAVVGEPVVDQPELGVGIQDLAGKVALEQCVLVAAVGHLDGGGVVVLADHDVAR